MEIGNSTTGCKRQNTGNELEDRISNLPDFILVHILSFLPTRDAVKTVLIPSFGRLWTNIHSLDFDGCSYHDCGDIVDYEDDRCRNFIRHALILHARATIYKFRLNFAFSFSYAWDASELQENQGDESYIRDMRIANEIDTWISFAVGREVKILDVDLKACDYVDLEYKLPIFVLSSCYLTELRLVSCALNPRGQIHMRSLRTLSLSEIKLSNKLINAILSGCPLLEDLSLIRCYGLLELNFMSPCLKKLVISKGYCRDESKLELSCPNVSLLHVSGFLEHVVLKNVASVVDAALDFSFGFRYAKKEYHEVRSLFEKLHHTKAFEMCTWCVMVFTIWELTKMPCPFFDWKHLILKTMLTKWHLHGMSCLLRSSPFLETLNLHVRPGISALNGVDGKWLKQYDFDEESYWNSLQPFQCLTNHLKTVNIYGCITHSNVIQMVKFLLRSSMVLEKIVIYTKQDEEQCLERLLEYTQKLSGFPRGSSRAVILFV